MLRARPTTLLPVLLAAGLLSSPVPAAGAASGCPDAELQLVEGTEQRVADAVRCLVAVERAARSLAGLAPNGKLDVAGRWHAEDMRDRSFFAHDAPAPAPHGTNAGERIDAAGYNWSVWGENIAVGFRTPASVMRGWMRSDGHCRNVLGDAFMHLGVGVVPGARPQWVQAFGTPAGRNASGPSIELNTACPAADLATGSAPGLVQALLAPVVTAVTQASTVLPVITFNARRVGSRVRVSGTVTGAVRRVKITVRRGSRSHARSIRVRSGRFAAYVRHPAGSGRTRVVVATAS